MRNPAVAVVLALALCSDANGQSPPAPVAASATGWGDCSGNIDARWLEDGRKMMLLADYTYTDPVSKSWLAPKGAKIDGASIPPALWSFIGGPFEGLYRKASVVHDVGCDEKKAEWRAVHKMFYDAMRCSNVTERRAKIMYWAVYHCGPRWGRDQGLQWCSTKVLADNVRRLKEFLRKRTQIELAQLQELTDKDLAQVEVNLRAFIEAVERLRRIVPVVMRDGAAVVVLSEGWLYEPGSKGLTRKGATRIEEVVSVFADLPDTEYVIRPFAVSPDDKTLVALSQQRATEVADRLVEFGVRNSQVLFAPARFQSALDERPAGTQLWQEIIVREGL